MNPFKAFLDWLGSISQPDDLIAEAELYQEHRDLGLIREDTDGSGGLAGSVGMSGGDGGCG